MKIKRVTPNLSKFCTISTNNKILSINWVHVLVFCFVLESVYITGMQSPVDQQLWYKYVSFS